ncbi:MAG: class I SAM-dependent methyltransferase [Bacteroidales bacterium]
MIQDTSHANHARPIAMPGTHEAFLRFFFQRERPPARVLDLGAGQGALSIKLYQAGFQVEACDFFPENFKIDEVVCQKADITQHLPYLDNTFDIVVAVEVTEHVTDHSRLFAEVFRILKPGGRLYVTTPNILSLKSRLRFLTSGFFYSFQPLHPQRNDGLQHVASLTADQYDYLGQLAGFEKVATFTDKIQKTSFGLSFLLFPLLILAPAARKTHYLHNRRVLLWGRLLFLLFKKSDRK